MNHIEALERERDLLSKSNDELREENKKLKASKEAYERDALSLLAISKAAADALEAAEQQAVVANSLCETLRQYLFDAEQRAQALVMFTEDILANGLRCDMNPTHDISSRDSSEEFWHVYIRSVEKSLKMRASFALASTADSAGTQEKGK